MSTSPSTAGWSWHRERTGIPGVVEIPTPYGGRWWADVLAPSRCVAFEAPTLPALVALSRLFGEQWRDAVIDAAPLGSASVDPGWAPPAVSQGWARLAVVRGVSRWMPYRLDEVALSIDEAIGWQVAGHPEMAAAHLAPVAELLVQLLDAKYDGLLPQAACLDVDLAVTIAKETLAETNPDRLAVIEADAAGDPPPVLSAAELERYLAAWTLDQLDLEPAMALSLHDEDFQSHAHPADLAAISPRVLEWRGPHYRELRISRVDGGIHIECRLDNEVDVTDGDAQRLRVYLAHALTGEILGEGSFAEDAAQPGGGLICATLALDESVDLDDLVVGVGHPDRRGTPRFTPTDRVLVDANRLLVGAWATKRWGVASDERSMDAASDHLHDAHNHLRSLPRAADEDPAVTAYRSYLDERVRLTEAYLGTASTAADPAVDRPLLAEILPRIGVLGGLPPAQR